MSLVPAFDAPVPRPPTGHPKVLQETLTRGTVFNVIFFALLLYGANEVRVRGIWDSDHYLSSSPLAIAFVMFVFIVWYSVQRYLLIGKLWQNGVTSPAEIVHVTKHITHRYRNGLHVGSREFYRMDARFKDSAQKEWDVTFDTKEDGLVESSRPPQGPFEVLFLPGRSAPGRVVVLESAEKMYECVTRKAGTGTIRRWLLWVPVALVVLAAAALVAPELYKRYLRSASESSEREAKAPAEQEALDWAGRPKKTPVEAEHPLTEIRGTRNRLMRVHYPLMFWPKNIEDPDEIGHVYPKMGFRLFNRQKERQILYLASAEDPGSELAKFDQKMHRRYLSDDIDGDETGKSETSTCAGLPALVHRATYKDDKKEDKLHVSCAIFHNGHAFYLSYVLPTFMDKDEPMLRAILDSTELY